MIRIDDNLLIDDSLITCAEYQLFLDEMRAQDKYFQPDHWTESQFPIGQAKAPVLGIRASDVIAFCDWLTARNADDWHFRLPTPREAQTYKFSPNLAEGMGYWAYSPLEQLRDFVWVGAYTPQLISNDAVTNPGENRPLDLDNTLKRVRDISSDTDPGSELDLAYARVIYRGLDSDMRQLSRRRPGGRNRNLVGELNLAYARLLYRGLANDNVRVRDLTKDLAHIQPRQRIREIDIGNDIARALDRARFRLVDIAHAVEITRDLSRDLANDISRANDYNIVRALFVDLFALQERIQGHLTPIEGIRIVQERKTN